MKTDGDDCYLKWEAKLDFRALRIAEHEAALLHLQNLWQEPLFNDDRPWLEIKRSTCALQLVVQV